MRFCDDCGQLSDDSSPICSDCIAEDLELKQEKACGIEMADLHQDCWCGAHQPDGLLKEVRYVGDSIRTALMALLREVA